MWARPWFVRACACASPLLLARVAAQEKKEVQPSPGDKPKQVIDGRLTGLDMPADWKLAERSKNLTYTNPSNQNLAARWVNGEIVYRISLGEVKVDPKTTKVAKEYIAVYAPPAPGDLPTSVERVSASSPSTTPSPAMRAIPRSGTTAT